MSNIQSPVSPPIQDGETACPACGHAEAAHDATSGRFCRASIDRTLDRACICSPRDDVPEGQTELPMYGRGRYSGR